MKKAFLQLHLAVFLAGFTALFGKLISLNELMLVFYRMLLSFAVLGLLMIVRKKKTTLALQEIRYMLLTGVVVAFHWVAFYGSVKYGSVSIAVVCISGTGFFSSLFEPFFFKRKIIWPELLLGLLAVAGILLIFGFNPQHKMGILFGLFSAIGGSLFQIMNKQLVRNHSIEDISLYEMIGGSVFLALLIPVYNQYAPVQHLLPTPTDWQWLVVLSVFCTVLCFFLQLNSLKKISAFTSNLSYNLEPIYGILLSFWLFQENKNLNGYFYVGVAIIFLSILLQMLRLWNIQKREHGLQPSPAV